MIETRGLCVTLAGRRVLGPTDVRLARGELVGICGPNGAGKSTLLKALAGVIAAQGIVEIDGVQHSGCATPARARQVAWLAQHRNPGWSLSVRELVQLGRHPWPRDAARDAREVDKALAQLALEALADRPLAELSGGEQARAHLARVLATASEAILADEPVAALDPAQQLRTLTLLRALAHAGRAVAVVLHDLGLLMRFCDRVLVLHAGTMVQQGAPDIALDDHTLAAVFGLRRASPAPNHPGGFELHG